LSDIESMICINSRNDIKLWVQIMLYTISTST